MGARGHFLYIQWTQSWGQSVDQRTTDYTSGGHGQSPESLSTSQSPGMYFLPVFTVWEVENELSPPNNVVMSLSGVICAGDRDRIRRGSGFADEQ